MDRSSDSDSKSHDHAKTNINQNSNMISLPPLSEDLMFHILTFVPIICLINSARYVCKTWAAIISSFGFYEACERRARSKQGLYVEGIMSSSSSYFLEFKDDDMNGEFEMFDLVTPRKMGDIITSCDGILLLSNDSGQIFAVNPILKRWFRIPPFPNSMQFPNIVRQCTIARVPGTFEFKVFLMNVLEISGSTWYVFYVLRIGVDNSWKEIARREIFRNQLFYREQICSGEKGLYWITIDEVVAIDVGEEIIVRGYPLPSESNNELMLDGLDPTYLWMGNHISCIVNEEGDFYKPYKVFILDFDSGKWSLYHEMRPFDDVDAYSHQLQILYVTYRFWIKDHIILLVSLSENPIGNRDPAIKMRHFTYNVKTRDLTEVQGLDLSSTAVWLHRNTLASLPSTPIDV
ncbi:unnamed protein product [Lathyrus sativus]|nr:unnamed protein product [Lathyrus sativus]